MHAFVCRLTSWDAHVSKCGHMCRYSTPIHVYIVLVTIWESISMHCFLFEVIEAWMAYMVGKTTCAHYSPALNLCSNHL